jgi:hypothetical protein
MRANEFSMRPLPARYTVSRVRDAAGRIAEDTGVAIDAAWVDTHDVWELVVEYSGEEWSFIYAEGHPARHEMMARIRDVQRHHDGAALQEMIDELPASAHRALQHDLDIESSEDWSASWHGSDASSDTTFETDSSFEDLSADSDDDDEEMEEDTAQEDEGEDDDCAYETQDDLE